MSPTRAAQAAAEAQSRPRVEGEREQEIFDATIDILAEQGYDRLTMDAVAGRAKASKATLYRRWNGKAQLVIDALTSTKEPMTAPDTGDLRGDLLGAFCGMGGLTDQRQIAIFGSVVTAISRDAEFAEAFRRGVVGPKKAIATEMFRRAQERGELRDDLDLELISSALPGIVLHHTFLLGEPPTTELIAKVVDQLILPAVIRG
ncbi:TetR/AcrR family transcriptional regulator [Nocardioides sp. NPDC126508]